MGAAVVAIIIRREKDAVEHFRRAGALSAHGAQSLGELGVEQSWIIDRMERRGILRTTGAGLFYLDEQAWAVNSRRRRRAAISIIIVVIALGAAVAVYTALHATGA